MSREKYELISNFLMGLANTDFYSFMEYIFDTQFENIQVYQIKQFEKKWNDGPCSIWYYLDQEGQKKMVEFCFSKFSI